MTLTTPGSNLVRGIHLAVAAIIAWMLLLHVGYSPMWDGRIYADCISAAARDLTPGALRCAGHAAHAYTGLAALVQFVSPGSFPLLLATNAALLLVACVAFHRLLALAFPVAELSVERAFLVAIFAAQPVLLAAVVQPGLDLAVVPAFIWCVVFALERRWLSLGVAGSALVFSKETGVLLYAILLMCSMLWHVRAELRGQMTLREAVRALPALAPLALFGAYLLYRASLPDQPVLWSGGTTGRSVVSQFLIPTLDLYQLSYAAIILVLSFGWIFSAIIALDAIVGGVRALERKPSRDVNGADRSRLLFLVVLTIVTGYALTRFTTFGNPRYVLVPRLLLLVPAFAALIRLGVGPRGRRTILIAAGALTVISAVRTVDPVSRSLYGTFAVGEHRMLRMTSITGECCGYGRDQLVYNLEFAWLQRAARMALTSVAPAASSPADSVMVVVPDSAVGTLVGAWLGGPNATARTPPSFPTLVTLIHSDLTSGRRALDSATFIAMPTVDYTRALRELSATYAAGAPDHFDWNGYRVSVYRMTRRRGSP